MATHIFIATTQGPVAIQKITEEEADVRSVVCIDGGSWPATISDRYYDFVKKGTGVIAREFGHDAYRIDVSANIESGNSWQLAVYFAHQLHKLGRLGNGQPQDNDLVILATGEVDNGLNIRAVSSVPKKAQESLSLLQRWYESNISVAFILPEQNRDLLCADWLADIGVRPQWCTLSYLDRPGSITDIEALYCEPKTFAIVSKQRNKNLRVAGLIFAIVFLAISIIAVGLVSDKKEINIADQELLDRSAEQDVITTVDQDGVLSADVEDISEFQLVATFNSGSGDCGDTDVRKAQFKLDDTRYFDELKNYRDMCQLVLIHTALPNSSYYVEALSLNSARPIPSFKLPSEGWQLANPKSRTNHLYAWLVFENKPNTNNWNRFIKALEKQNILDQDKLKLDGELEKILSTNNLSANVFRHSLKY